MFLYLASLSLHFVVLDVKVRFAAQPSKDTFFSIDFLYLCVGNYHGKTSKGVRKLRFIYEALYIHYKLVSFLELCILRKYLEVLNESLRPQ
jgi:hypothetical protein